MDIYKPVSQLDEITQKAAKLFNVPFAMINLVTSDKILFKSCTGLTQGDSLNRQGSFCSMASSQEKPLAISDATIDPQFQNNDLVKGDLKIRSYLGKSLHRADGSVIGTLCLLDTKPRKYSVSQLSALKDLAKKAEAEFNSILKAH